MPTPEEQAVMDRQSAAETWKKGEFKCTVCGDRTQDGYIRLRCYIRGCGGLYELQAAES